MHCKSNQCCDSSHAYLDRYFLFQAALILCLCLRSQQDSPSTNEWREQINVALRLMESLGRWTNSSKACYEVLQRLCQGRLRNNTEVPDGIMSSTNPYTVQMDENWSAAWPDVYPIEDFDEGMMMQADFWTDLLPEGM
jgi:hypothetical protein